MDYFTNKELSDIQEALSDLSKVHVYIRTHNDADEQRRGFFDKAKIWRVIQRIIAALYIEKLKKGPLVLVDMEGHRYTVTLQKEEVFDES